MFDPSKTVRIAPDNVTAPAPANGDDEDTFGGLNLRLLTVPELMRLHDKVIAALPPTALSEMNLEKELLLQYHSVKALKNEVMDGNSAEAGAIPMNQRAQVANTVATALKALIDLQDKVYATERFKFVESLLIRSLTKLPEKTASKFLDEYEKGTKDFRA